MAPTIALAALMILFAFSEYNASKTRATISSVLALAVLMLAGFWTGILPNFWYVDCRFINYIACYHA